MIRWQKPISSDRNASRGLVSSLALLGLFVIGLSYQRQCALPVIVYNASPSVPLGFYRVEPVKALKLGDLVLMTTPEAVRTLADKRHYLPASVPMIKHIAALSGDVICSENDKISINGKVIVRRLRHDRFGRQLPQWQACLRLKQGQMLVLNPDAPQSFDGRYFGVVITGLIRGKLVKL